MDDLISRQAAIDARRYSFGNDEFSLGAAYHDCKLVFDGITDDDSFQEADTGLILYYANEIIYALQKALEGKDINVPSSCSESPNNSSAQPEYEPVTAEDFAKTMSKNTLYSFMAWHGEALTLMKEQGFVICKKTM